MQYQYVALIFVAVLMLGGGVSLHVKRMQLWNPRGIFGLLLLLGSLIAVVFGLVIIVVTFLLKGWPPA